MWLAASLSHITNLCNEAFINKIGLSPTIFVPGPEEVICGVRSYSSVCGLRFANLVLLSDLCAWMLGQLGTKVHKALKMEVGVLVGWVPRSLKPRIFTKCGHVQKG